MIFVSWRLYGQRPRFHFDLYEQSPGWWFLEVCCWTVEIDLNRLPFYRSKA